MKKIVLTFGIIAGLLCSVMFLFYIPTDGKMDFSNSMLYGYISMTIALSTIFFAVKQYRDKYNDGVVNFGKAFLIGLYITLVAGVVYAICWDIFFVNYVPDFGEQYVNYIEEQMVSSGASKEEIALKLDPQRKQMAEYATNRPLRMGYTILEILPVGLIMSLLSAALFGLFLKRKKWEGKE